jgi:hypothetical protein
MCVSHRCPLSRSLLGVVRITKALKISLVVHAAPLDWDDVIDLGRARDSTLTPTCGAKWVKAQPEGAPLHCCLASQPLALVALHALAVDLLGRTPARRAKHGGLPRGHGHHLDAE